MGHPIAHSMSPALHRAAWEQLGLTGGSYERVEVPEGGLARAVEELHGAGGVRALSVTMPLKAEALALGVAGVGADEASRRAGGANTLVWHDLGWWAANTDVPALERVIGRNLPEGRRGPAVLLGSGATARSALLALHRTGVTKLTVVVRREVRPELHTLADELGVGLTVARLTGLDGLLRGAAGDGPRQGTAAPLLEGTSAPLLVVNTLPAGWWETLPAPAWGQEGAGLVWVDAQYADWPHPWAAAAEGSGARVVSGLHMLVEQAVDQVELMTGHRPTAEGTAGGLPAELRALHRL
ncbi:shikimate dehydrogenase family protein [Kytococcus sedentarius]|uniref:shikimate dehydrogenase family protein n=1 Tax=Kytococcus sedentarius TaxID=1276 RepID=UPI0035BC400F